MPEIEASPSEIESIEERLGNIAVLLTSIESMIFIVQLELQEICEDERKSRAG
jgi:hypothetical protein